MDLENIQFNPIELLQDYHDREYDRVSEQLLEILRHFDRVTYLELTIESKYFINAFVKSFLYIFTQPDYILSDRHGLSFIQSNLIISNLVAMSDFGTTDPYLELLRVQSQNFIKILALCSARNSFIIDRKLLFDTNIELASRWYSIYFETYRSGLINPTVHRNLHEHLLYEDDRLTNFYQIDDLYFGATYIDGENDGILKTKINRSIQNSQVIKNVSIDNHPNAKKIAIASAFWFAEHSVYRILSASIAALKDSYELTLIHLGDRDLPIDIEHFTEVKYLQIQNGQFDLSTIQENKFAAIYFPDIGMSLESILLSNLRIAPIQICGLGHPVSTYSSEIDYFISGEDSELIDKAKANYTEKLVLLPGSGAVNNRPNYQLKSRSPKSLKPTPIVIINCPWYPQKVNHPLLLSLQEIIQCSTGAATSEAEATPTSKRRILFRFFAGGGLSNKNDFIPFAKEIEKILGAEHICVYPYKTYPEYMEIMAEGDICLDSYHFSGFNVIVDGLYLRKPTIVFKGKHWYNRAGANLMDKIGLSELIATTPREYIQLTIKLINDEDFRRKMQMKIDGIDLEQLIFISDNGKYFKQAIDFLLENHHHLKIDPDRNPIQIRLHSEIQ
jgi:Glycosyl transferase family 41